MQKIIRTSIVIFIFGLAALIVWSAVSPVAAMEGSGRTRSASASISSENWNMGVTVEGAPAYSAVVGRLVSDVGAFRSARATQGATIFPAPASQKTIEAASVYLLSRSGTYTGTVTLSLAIYDFSGTLMHKVNSVDIDLQNSPTGAWIPLTLSSTPADLSLAPGEFLAFTYALDSTAGGNLDIRPIFDVIVQ
ncbi:MAG: hypothetical protein JW908_12375 [Anaerolineales bacterium]|nr:hypothetical protein [Anaerolineales bacterium]